MAEQHTAQAGGGVPVEGALPKRQTGAMGGHPHGRKQAPAPPLSRVLACQQTGQEYSAGVERLRVAREAVLWLEVGWAGAVRACE